MISVVSNGNQADHFIIYMHLSKQALLAGMLEIFYSTMYMANFAIGLVITLRWCKAKFLRETFVASALHKENFKWVWTSHIINKNKSAIKILHTQYHYVANNPNLFIFSLNQIFF